MHKFFLSAAILSTIAATAADDVRVVNFSSCVMESKAGKKEQENLDGIRKQMSSLMENTEKELKEIAAKFEDAEYLDSLTPKAEEELKVKFQTLQEDLSRYQNQFYQILNQANYQILQKMNGVIAKAAEKVAEQHKADYVINKEACFYIRPDKGYDVTKLVIDAMDEAYEAENALSENKELAAPQDAKKAN